MLGDYWVSSLPLFQMECLTLFLLYHYLLDVLPCLDFTIMSDVHLDTEQMVDKLAFRSRAPTIRNNMRA